MLSFSSEETFLQDFLVILKRILTKYFLGTLQNCQILKKCFLDTTLIYNSSFKSAITQWCVIRGINVGDKQGWVDKSSQSRIV